MTKRLDIVIRYALDSSMVLPAVMAPFLLANPYSLPKVVLLRVILIIIVAAWLGKIVVSGRLKVAQIGGHPAFIVFLLVLVSTTVLSAAPVVSLFGNYFRHEGLVTWLAYVAIFIAAATHSAEEEIEHRLKVGLLIALPITIYALVQFLGWDFVPLSGARLNRSSASLGNPTYLGAYLVMIFPLSLSFALIDRSRARYLYGLVSILSALALIFTYSRAAWLGVAVGAALLAVRIRRGERRDWFLVAGSLAIALVAIGALHAANPEKSYVRARLVSSVNLSEGSVGERLGLWRTGVNVVLERPFFGWGLETFRDASRPYQADNREGLAPNRDRPHNQLLYLASSVGLVGLTAYILFVVAVFTRILRAAKEKEDMRDRLLAAGILAALIGYVIQEQFSFSQVETAPLFWLLMGFGVALGRPEPLVKTYDFSRRPMILGLAATVISIALALLAVVNFRFLVADYRYGGHPAGETRLANLSSAVTLNPYENTYRHALAVHLIELGRLSGDKALYIRAASELERALSVNRRDRVVAVNLAKTYEALSETDSLYLGKAIAAYERVLKIEPGYTAAHRSLKTLKSRLP